MAGSYSHVRMTDVDRLAPSYKCPECGFELWHAIARLRRSTLGLYDDARFPGRCLLVFERHVSDFAELDDDDTLAFVREAHRVAAALKAVTGAERVNYAVLGNAVAHLHFHLIPRGGEHDVVPGKAPWAHPDPASPLPTGERNSLIARIARELERA